MKKNDGRSLFLIIGLSCVVAFTQRAIGHSANDLANIRWATSRGQSM
jgi:hypothetical protein